MIELFRKEGHGHFQNEWLNSYHHFSFGEYYNPQRRQFGTLRVINDDEIKAGAGFGRHPHKDMEIITYVRSGAVHHQDSLGNEGVTAAGDVQVMSAGCGIEHAEFSAPDQDTTLFQIWIRPRENNLPPRWEQAAFPKQPTTEKLALLVSGRAEDEGQGALYIHQDAAIYGGRLPPGAALDHELSGAQAYIVISEGQADINGTVMAKGDGGEVTSEQALHIAALDEACELLVIELG